MNTVDGTGHPGRCRTGHNRRMLCIGHCGNGHDGRPISFGCRHDGSRRHGVDDPVIVVARYPDFGRIAAHPDVNMYFKA